MTKDEMEKATLEELAKLADGISPGPWSVRREHYSRGQHAHTDRELVGPKIDSDFATGTAAGDRADRDAEFIAAAPQLVAELLRRCQERDRRIAELGQVIADLELRR